MPAPEILYKIVTQKQFADSHERDVLLLSESDQKFIHFSTKEQYPEILQKLANRAPLEQYLVLEVNTKQLVGDMKFEANPGKSEKFFHLYNGYIPMSALSLINPPDDCLESSSSLRPS